VRRFHALCLILFGLFSVLARGETFTLSNGETLTGEVLTNSANDLGVQVKVGEGEYKRIPWSNFLQEDLRNFAQNKKMEPFVQPFIEISPEEKAKKTEVTIKQPERVKRAEKHSLIGSFFSSGLGILVLLILYAANIYAALEIAIFRGQPLLLVCGVAAILPIIGPIIFVSMPTRLQPSEQTWETAPPPQESAGAEPVNPMQGDAESLPASSLHIAQPEPQSAKPSVPATETFQRGQFTFNRRFFETKFPGFFGVVRRDADRDMVLQIKTSRGEFAGQRISRIAANELHLEVAKGQVSEEVTIPFIEIQQIQLKHKDAP
jgi:hypothetical protein